MRITATVIAAAPLVYAACFGVTASSGSAAAQNAPAAASETSAAAVLVGKPAPDFALPDQNNETRNLSKHRGKWVVLAFYPADKTRG